MAPQLDYWKEQLAGALTGPPLRGDLPGTPGATSKGGLVPMALPTDLVRSLRSLAAACGATLFVVVLAAWKARAQASCSCAGQRRHAQTPQWQSVSLPCTCFIISVGMAQLHKHWRCQPQHGRLWASSTLAGLLSTALCACMSAPA